MGDSENKLRELKTIINSLVIPHPDGLSLRHLCNDYTELEGQMIPFREVGFSSVTALLKSMPDMIRMIGDLQNIASVVLYPVRSDDTKHIIDLVQKQNKGKKKARRPQFGYYNNIPQPLLWSTRTPRVEKPIFKSWNPSFNRPLVRCSNVKAQPLVWTTPRPLIWTIPTTLNVEKPIVTQMNQMNLGMASNRPLLPTPVVCKTPIPKEKIKLMMSSPDIAEGFMLFNFEARYRHQFKETFDYKSYGFQTLIDCLLSLPDVLEMIPTGTKTYKLMPLRNTSPLQSKSVPTTSTTVITNGQSIAVITSTPTSMTVTLVTTHSTITTTTAVSTTTCVPKATTVSTIANKLFTIPASKPKSNVVPEVVPEIVPEVEPELPEVVVCPTQAPKVEKCLDEQSIWSSSSNDSNVINTKAKQNFRTILLFHELGINALDFASEYQKHFKVRFDSRIWGFKSDMELFHGLPQIFAIEVNENNEEILHDSRFKKFAKPKPTITLDLNTKFLLRQIPDTMFARILHLIQSSEPTGLPLTNFVTMYESKYNSIEQTLKQLRFSDALHLFEAIKNELPIDVRSIDGQKTAFIKSKEELSHWIVRQTRASKFVIPNTLVETPPNIVLPGEHFRPIQLPERFKPGNYEYVAVYISSAVNPHEIYVQFKGSEYHTALENLMFSLDFYETAPEKQWSVPFEFLYVGFPIVCRYPGDKNWHRARICRIHTSDKRVVTVSFVDYGGTHVLDYKNLRLMKKEFLSLPVQALKVGLYGIKPILGSKASDWTASARDKLLRFSRPQYALACTLIEARPDNHWVAICDTNSQLDVFLHLILVNDKHALMSDDTDSEEGTDNPPHNGIDHNSKHILLTNGFNGF